MPFLRTCSLSAMVEVLECYAGIGGDDGDLVFVEG